MLSRARELTRHISPSCAPKSTRVRVQRHTSLSLAPRRHPHTTPGHQHATHLQLPSSPPPPGKLSVEPQVTWAACATAAQTMLGPAPPPSSLSPAREAGDRAAEAKRGGGEAAAGACCRLRRSVARWAATRRATATAAAARSSCPKARARSTRAAGRAGSNDSSTIAAVDV